MPYSFQPMDVATARLIAGWRYDEPYDFYNADPANLHDDIDGLMDPAFHYYAMRDEDDDLIAYCCFGDDARVGGGDYGSGALDVGAGMRPDLTGKGRGGALVAAIMEFGRRTFAPAAFRATVAAFNQRALKACQHAGFEERQRFVRPSDGREFVILVAGQPAAQGAPATSHPRGPRVPSRAKKK